jgi:hypothetical protein
MGIGAQVTLVRATSNPKRISIADQAASIMQGPNAYHNMVTIDIPLSEVDGPDASRVVAHFLEKAGVRSPRPAEERDMRTFIENRLIGLLVGVNDPANNIIEQDRRDDLLRQIKEKYGVAPEDVKVTVDSGGSVRYIMPEKFVFDTIEKTGTGFFLHRLNLNLFTVSEDYEAIFGRQPTSEQAREFMIKSLAGIIAGPDADGFGGLLSTTSRTLEGLSVTGMSSKTDIHSGGADYVYLSPMPGLHSYTQMVNGSMSIIFDAASVYERSDLYANSTDQFGSRTPKGGYQIGVYSETLPFMYETMIKGRLGMDAAVGITVHNDLYDSLIFELRRRGVTEINGVPVETFIIRNGQANSSGRANALDTRYHTKVLKEQGMTEELSASSIGLVKLPELYANRKYSTLAATSYMEFVELATEGEVEYSTPPGTALVVARRNGSLLVRHSDGLLFEYAPSTPGLLPPTPRSINSDEANEIYNTIFYGQPGADKFSWSPLGVIAGPDAYDGGYEGEIEALKRLMKNDGSSTILATRILNMIESSEPESELHVVGLLFDFLDENRYRLSQLDLQPLFRLFLGKETVV